MKLLTADKRFWIVILAALAGAAMSLASDEAEGVDETLTDFRVRADFDASLNADAGWAAPVNERARVAVDQPFRLRVQLESAPGRDVLRHYVLHVRRNGGPWMPVVAADFPYPAYASPRVSIVSPRYDGGEPTGDLLPQKRTEHGDDGRGVGLTPVSPRAGERGDATEWEWPLVIRHYADGPVRTEDGDVFEFRLAHLHGGPVPQDVTPSVTAEVPARHLGGTYVESPGRIGPWETPGGDLYFIMEPTETDNRLMIVKSTDGGRTWREADSNHRPPARDLEAVDSRLQDGTLHLLHQEDSVWYHRFETSASSGAPDRWTVRSEPVATPEEPPVQSVALAALEDGRLVGVHADGPELVIRVRGAGGQWRKLHTLSADERLSGAQAVTAPNGRVHLVYTRGDGTAWARSLAPDLSLGRAALLSERIGEAEADVGSILPPVYLPASEEVVFVYRERSGLLFERRLDVGSGTLTDPVRISDLPVVQNAVDSDQAGADLVRAGSELAILFIEEASRDLFVTTSKRHGGWSEPQLLVTEIDGSWVRGRALDNGEIAYVYDAGSRGGAGMNRFGVVSETDIVTNADGRTKRDERADRAIENPILRGFNPDPSILRVGDDYYIATSTFEWWPAVRIHHSKDLVNWRLLTHAVTRPSQLDLVGNQPSRGAWAPQLSYDDGTFYLVYTNVRNVSGGFVDAHNYLITASDIEGPWSEPIELNSGGFDPSLFHDRDGRKYLLNMVWDHRAENKSRGIVLQEYDPSARQLIGSPRLIFRGTELGGTEAPHVYRHDEHYYLLTAEGGTGYGHAVTVARSRSLTGPYEVDPDNPVLTSRNDPALDLQKAGHASLVTTPHGKVYLAFLCARPLPGTRRCPLGRETALIRARWSEDGWLRVIGSSGTPRRAVVAPDGPPHPFPDPLSRVDFDRGPLDPRFQTLREPPRETWLSLSDRPGFLRLRGRESPTSVFHKSLVARRVQHFRYQATTAADFEPETFQQLAGLVAWYDERHHAYLRISRDERHGRNVAVLRADRGRLSISEAVPLPEEGRVWLRVRTEGRSMRFSFSLDGEEWSPVGPEYDASKLSDDYSRGFTGTFVGMMVNDMSGRHAAADFDFFEYETLD